MILRNYKYTRSEASAKAKQLDSTAFAKRAVDCPLSERCQILIEAADATGWGKGGTETYLVASGPTWAKALEAFYDWVQLHKAEEPHGEEKAKAQG